jgi:hypothetical protein
LLCATGSATTEPSRPLGVSSEPISVCTLSATSVFVTSREAVSTSRVGSTDSRINGRLVSVGSSAETGVTSMSAVAS